MLVKSPKPLLLLALVAAFAVTITLDVFCADTGVTKPAEDRIKEHAIELAQWGEKFGREKKAFEDAEANVKKITQELGAKELDLANKKIKLVTLLDQVKNATTAAAVKLAEQQAGAAAVELRDARIVRDQTKQKLEEAERDHDARKELVASAKKATEDVIAKIRNATGELALSKKQAEDAKNKAETEKKAAIVARDTATKIEDARERAEKSAKTAAANSKIAADSAQTAADAAKTAAKAAKTAAHAFTTVADAAKPAVEASTRAAKFAREAAEFAKTAAQSAKAAKDAADAAKPAAEKAAAAAKTDAKDANAAAAAAKNAADAAKKAATKASADAKTAADAAKPKVEKAAAAEKVAAAAKRTAEQAAADAKTAAEEAAAAAKTAADAAKPVPATTPVAAAVPSNDPDVEPAMTAADPATTAQEAAATAAKAARIAEAAATQLGENEPKVADDQAPEKDTTAAHSGSQDEPNHTSHFGEDESQAPSQAIDAFVRLPLVTGVERARAIDDFCQAANKDLNKCDSSKQYAFDYRFDAAAQFPLASFGLGGERTEQEGAIIYEGMRFAIAADGRYQVRFVVGTPAMPVTMRLQLILEDQGTQNRYTLTLPPISIPELDKPDHTFQQREVDPVYGNIQTVHHEGYLPTLEGRTEHIRVVRRTGSARFGFGVNVP